MLKTDDSYFKSIVETIRHPLLVLDNSLRVITANKSFYETFKVSADETLNQHIYKLGNGQWNISILKTLFEEVLPRNIQITDFEVEHDFPSIGRRWMLLNASRIVSRDDNSNLILLAIEDITKAKILEEEQKVFTAQLESSNRELQSFAQIASHDLQEPLRKIQAFGDCLKTEAAGNLIGESRDYLERMLNAASRMQEQINDLLAFSRIESKPPNFEKIDLEQIANEVVEDLEATIRYVNGKIEIGDLLTIEADPMQIRQLLQNLIGNALKYHKAQTPPVIKIYAETVDLENNLTIEKACRIFVEDNGIGFDEKYLDRIFNIFQRLHGRYEYEGTGIGLAICLKIVERHRGAITARSKPGSGATFIATLPIKQNKTAELV